MEKDVNNINNSKRQFRRFIKLLIFSVVVVIMVIIGLLVYDNYQYKSYKIIPADFVDQEKVYKGGLSYNKAVYKYKVKGKEYFYNNPELYKENAPEIIQIKYDKANPNNVYDSNLSKIYFIILIVSIAVFILLNILLVAFSPSKVEKIITAQVIEIINCVGGKRIYLSDINILKESTEAPKEKYYVFFSDDMDKFSLGNIISFNKYKYGEGIIKEKYKTVTANCIYNFKDTDFSVIKKAS